MFSDSDQNKLGDLVRRIEKAEEASSPKARREVGDSRRTSRAIIRAVRLGSDFVALVMGLAFFGWLVDRQFGVAPWFMLGMIVLGFCAGFWMIVRGLSGPDVDDDSGSKGNAAKMKE